MSFTFIGNGSNSKVAILTKPMENNLYCGDLGGYWTVGNKHMICLADGLGHGEQAQEASQTALNYVADHLTETLPTLFLGCDSMLRDTRGVAMAVAVVDQTTGDLTYASINNIYAVVLGENTTKLPASPGIVGGGYKKLTTVPLKLSSGDLIIMCTDGIKIGDDLLRYIGARHGDLRRLSERVLHEYRIGTDDAGVLIFRH